MAIPTYSARHQIDVLQIALLLAGRTPAVLGEGDLAYFDADHPICLSAIASGVIVGRNDGYDVRSVCRADIGEMIARVHQRGD